MTRIKDLKDMSPQEWDAEITRELTEADIPIHKFRDYDTPGFWPKHTLKAKLAEGKCCFLRAERVWQLWCQIPLATAEVIHLDPVCCEGMRHGDGHNYPISELSELTYPINEACWMTDEGVSLIRDEGWNDQIKEVILHDSPNSIIVADPTDPAHGGKPYVMGYNFFTMEAMKRFAEILRRHRV